MDSRAGPTGLRTRIKPRATTRVGRVERLLRRLVGETRRFTRSAIAGPRCSLYSGGSSPWATVRSGGTSRHVAELGSGPRSPSNLPISPGGSHATTTTTVPGTAFCEARAADSLSAHGRRRLRGSSSGRPLAVLPIAQTSLIAPAQSLSCVRARTEAVRSSKGEIRERRRRGMSLTNGELLTFEVKRSRCSSGLSISDDPEGSPRSAGNLRLMAH